MATATLRIYIGANNQTKELELDNIRDIFAGSHEGFTIEQATGYWHGVPENTAIVTVSDEYKRILATIKRARRLLDQEAIAFQRVEELEFVS